MSNILELPKHRIRRAEKLRKMETKKVVASLSLVTVVMSLVFISEFIQRQARPVILISDNQEGRTFLKGLAPGERLTDRLHQRNVASQVNGEFRDLEWEKKLVQKLSSGERSVASLSVAPEDQFKYGYLGGNYRIVNEESPDGKVYLSQVEYRSDTTDVVAQPVLFDVQTFVQSYKTVGFSFSNYKVEDLVDGKKLIFFGANSKDIVGEVYIQLKENRLISAKVQRL
jgi:hypothetical protein